MWGSDGRVVIDGNLNLLNTLSACPTIHVPTLIGVGDTMSATPR